MKYNAIIYQIFVRNYSQDGTFDSVRKDLDRIKELGVDIIYLMPIHEIGVKNRKGTYGSPYAIKDYFSISKDLGTLKDFKNLIKDIHDKGMKIILDMVFNHTSPDNLLLKDHKDYYFHKDGKLSYRVGEWTDIVDLDYKNPDTQDYLLSVLKYWTNLGVDGFRFDVASMIPLSFFKNARDKLGKEVIFLGESIDPGFADYLRSINDNPTPDEDMYPTFDSLYNYNYFRDLIGYIKGEKPIDSLIDLLNKDGANLRALCLENHDNERISSLLNEDKLKHYLDFLSFTKGQVYIYAGQEYGNKHKPELFEKDPVNWEEKDNSILNLYKEYIASKKKQQLIIFQQFKKIDDCHLEVLITYHTGERDRKVFFLPHN